VVKKHSYSTRPDFLYTPRPIQVVFVAYAIPSVTFSLYFAVQLGTVFIPYAVHTINVNVAALWSACREGKFTLDVVRVTFQTVLIVLSCWGVVQLLIGSIRKGHRMFSVERRQKSRRMTANGADCPIID
jgi:hypothetical protein